MSSESKGAIIHRHNQTSVIRLPRWETQKGKDMELAIARIDQYALPKKPGG